MDLYYADLAQPLTTAGEELDDLDHDLSDLSEKILHWELIAGRADIRYSMYRLLKQKQLRN